jgi:hypothetical protein
MLFGPDIGYNGGFVQLIGNKRRQLVEYCDIFGIHQNDLQDQCERPAARHGASGIHVAMNWIRKHLSRLQVQPTRRARFVRLPGPLCLRCS